LAEPHELTVSTSKPPCEPIGHVNPNEPLPASGVENDRVKGAKRQAAPRSGGWFGGFSVAHVEEWLLVGETSPQGGEFNICLLDRCRNACPMTHDEPDPCSDNCRNSHNTDHTNEAEYLTNIASHGSLIVIRLPNETVEKLRDNQMQGIETQSATPDRRS